MILHRHDLILLTEQGRRQALERLPQAEQCEARALWEQFPKIPLICASQQPEKIPGWVDCGLSFPLRVEENRKRFRLSAAETEITETVTPFQVAGLPIPDGAQSGLLREVMEAAEKSGIRLGLFGSTALQMFTGYPYLHQGSDLDLLIRTQSVDSLKEFAGSVQALKQASHAALDIEVMLAGGWYCKLSELLSGSQTVLAKGECGLTLLSSACVWEGLTHTAE